MTPAEVMNNSINMMNHLNNVRFPARNSRELKYSFTMGIGGTSMIVLAIAESDGLNYSQAIQDGLDYVCDELNQIERHCVCTCSYNEEMNITTYFIIPV